MTLPTAKTTLSYLIALVLASTTLILALAPLQSAQAHISAGSTPPSTNR
jgi:hypothetical protein